MDSTKIAIIGFSREGQSVFKFLKQHGTALEKLPPQREYWILDKNPRLKTPRGVKAQLGKNYLKNLDRFDLVFRSPGVVKDLRQAGFDHQPFSSATTLFFKHCPCPIIGITGTKGKGTTATLLYKMLEAAKKDVYLIGNIGTPDWLNLLPKLKKNSIVVFELSSFQLMDLRTSPHIAVVLDIAPDHLDEHRSMKEYLDSKAHIATHQKIGDFIFYAATNSGAKKIAAKSRGQKIAVNSSNLPKDLSSLLYLSAPHLEKNATTAIAIARHLGVSKEIIKKTLKNFKGNEHRLEFVKKIKGVSYYNDSAATNPISTEAALKSFRQPIILIVGGKNKGFSYKQLGKAIDHSTVSSVVLLGENKKEIARHIKKKPKKEVGTLEKALLLSHKLARPGMIVLLSPASTSLDMFQSYVARGTLFKKIVKEALSK